MGCLESNITRTQSCITVNLTQRVTCITASVLQACSITVGNPLYVVDGRLYASDAALYVKK